MYVVVLYTTVFIPNAINGRDIWMIILVNVKSIFKIIHVNWKVMLQKMIAGLLKISKGGALFYMKIMDWEKCLSCRHTVHKEPQEKMNALLTRKIERENCIRWSRCCWIIHNIRHTKHPTIISHLQISKRCAAKTDLYKMVKTLRKLDRILRALTNSLPIRRTNMGQRYMRLTALRTHKRPYVLQNVQESSKEQHKSLKPHEDVRCTLRK